MSRSLLPVGLLVATLLAGCVADWGYYDPEHSGLIRTNYAAADALVARSTQPLGPSTPVLITPAVNLDRPKDATALGRVIAEQISARLTHHGVAVVSGDVGDLARPPVQAVLVVSYAVARSYVFVNVKLVNTQANIVSSAHDYRLPLTRAVSGLLPASQLKY